MTALRVAAVGLAAACAHAADRPVHTLAGGPYEASGAVQSPDGKGVLFVDDARPDTVFSMDFAVDGSPAGPATAIPVGTSVVDPEGITTDGAYVYVVGSQSRGAPMALDLGGGAVAPSGAGSRSASRS